MPTYPQYPKPPTSYTGDIEVGDLVLVANKPPGPSGRLERPVLAMVIKVDPEKIAVRESIASNRQRDNVWPLSHPRCQNRALFDEGDPDHGVYELAGTTKKLLALTKAVASLDLGLTAALREIAALKAANSRPQPSPTAATVPTKPTRQVTKPPRAAKPARAKEEPVSTS